MKDLSEYALEKVKEFRTASGLPCDNGVMAQHDLHHNLYTEEFDEYHEAETLSQKADSYADQLVVAAGYQLDAGNDYFVPFNEWPSSDYWKLVASLDNLSSKENIDLKTAFDIAHNSNMTKFTDSFDIATESVEWYANKGIETNIRKTNGIWAIYSSKDQVVDSKSYPKGKLLKMTCFVEPDWSGEEWLIK